LTGSDTRQYRATSLLAVPAPHGERAVAVTDAYRIAFLNPTGDTVRVLSRTAPRTPLPDEAWSELQAEYDEWKADYAGADCEGEISEPEYMPVLRALHFSYDGRMLVEYNAPTGPAFDVFSPEGIWVGTMPMPDRDEFVPAFLRSDRFYIGTKDSLDVQQVRVFKVHAENDGRPRGE